METCRRIKLIRILEHIDKQREYALKLGLKSNLRNENKHGGNHYEKAQEEPARSSEVYARFE